MKRIFAVVLCFIICLLFSGCSHWNNLEEVRNEIISTPVETNREEVRAVWFAYYELENFTNSNDESAFYDKINAAFGELNEMGFNTVTVQVRPCADAFYQSNYFPSSKYCFGEQGSEMPYDPLSIMCDLAHQNHLKIEAWINPYRVSQDNDIDALCDSNQAKIWYYDEENTNNVYLTDSAIYFNPAAAGVTELIVNGVQEIVAGYSVDAIHFDDYFYPSKDEAIDEAEYQKYVDNGGELSLSDFRREAVSNMIKTVYTAVKSVNSEVRFGVSPASNIDNDYNTLYADVEKWVSEEGYVDYIVPQIYFGFQNIYQPFMFTTKKWIGITDCDLYVGLPLYKSGKPDKYAAEEDEAIINEFVNNNNIIGRQISYLSKLSEVKGFYIFSYSCLTDNDCKEEVENMLAAMQSSSQYQHQSS